MGIIIFMQDKVQAPGRIPFALMGGTQKQQAFSLFHSCIWRTVSFQALPKRVLMMRNILLFTTLLMLAVDAYDSYLYAVFFQMYSAMNPVNIPYMYQGMLRDWLALCFAGSLCMFFGNMWLYKEMILVGSIITFVFLPGYTTAYLYLRYNQPMSTVFTTWWYAAVCIFQFFQGLAGFYLYAWLKVDLEARERETCIK